MIHTFESEFEVGDHVCFVGDGQDANRFAIVLGFAYYSPTDIRVIVSWGGSEPIECSPHQIEPQQKRYLDSL